MDEAAAPAGRIPASGPEVAGRLRALARAVPPLEIAELWMFPPLAELESSAEFFLFTRFDGSGRRTLYSARVRRENGSGDRQVVVEHGSVPADRVPGLVRRLQRRLGEHRQPFHVAIEGSLARWSALCEEGRGEGGSERASANGSSPADPIAAGSPSEPAARNGVGSD